MQVIPEQKSDHQLAKAYKLASFKLASGAEMRGQLVRVRASEATFETFGADEPLRVSEVLTQFKIVAGELVVYEGNAIVQSIISTGSSMVHVVTLSSPVLDAQVTAHHNLPAAIPSAYTGFLQSWQSNSRINPEFKDAVFELEDHLAQLRQWLDQLDATLERMPVEQRRAQEQGILDAMPFRPALDALFERFEVAAAKVPAEQLEAHRQYCRRHLHPLIMCSPFMHRIFVKPLGYAGDYEMIDMIIRNQLEGKSLFAKLLHKFILDTPPAHSVRNRAHYFTRRFAEEGMRVLNAGLTPRFFSLGCGPAREVQDFLVENPMSNQTQFTLLDFNPQTLEHTGKRLEQIRSRCGRQATIRTIQKSVYYLLKESARNVTDAEKHDVIYCSGLYDYLSDRVCKQLNTYLYNFLRPGGVLIVTNFDPINPIRNIMEFVYEWFLIHRDARGMAAMAPEQAARDDWRVISEPTGCNVFLEARKPR